MKKFYFLIFTLCLLWVLQLNAQQPVRFSNGDFLPNNNVQNRTLQKESLEASLFGDNYFVLLQFSQLPDTQTKQWLKAAGVDLGSYIPGNAYLATVKSNFSLTTLEKYKITSINTIPVFYKIDKSLSAYQKADNKDDIKALAVSYYPSVNKDTVQSALQQSGAIIVKSNLILPNVVFIDPSTKMDVINNIAALPFISYISLQSLSAKPLNNTNSGTHGVSGLQSVSGRNLQGTDVTVGVGDNANIYTHVDFNERLINRCYNVAQIHGTHTSGTTAGAGIVNPLYKGIAPKATIVSQWFTEIILNTPTYVADYNMTATNNSYHSAALGCPGNGIYDILSSYEDAQMGVYDEVLHVFAAGNDGLLTCTPFPASFGTVKSGWQSGKNVLTVGNMVGSNYAINAGSSRGPVQDGRIKPEIVANGTSTISTIPNNNYGASSGTSMAAPVVTGITTLLTERYKQLNGNANPKAALIKALLCNTAEDIGNPGPDYTYGFGLANARKTVEALEGNRYFISSTTPSTNTIAVPMGVRRLKVMLYWADAAAIPNSATALVNDLDLTVTNPAIFLPLILDPTPANVNNAAIPGADHTNNIEQVVIDNPTPGNYDLNVTAFALPSGPQEYVLTYEMDMNGITVEYPFGGETFVPGETETIRWTAYGDEGNTFTIEYFDGASWNVIDNNVAATARSLNWVVPATVSNNYLIRVSRNGGSGYTDQSDFSFTVLGQPTLTTSVPCQGYVQLDWTAVSGAASYDILQLRGDQMEVIDNTTNLSYMVSGLNSTESYWFGISAKNNAQNGRRSVSKNVTPQTGACSLPDFDNNFKAVSIDELVSGRQFTSSALTATEQIKLTITNLDDVASSGSYDLSYRINGGSIVTESSSVVIPSQGSTTYTFTATVDLSSSGTYDIEAWVKRTGDTQVSDDTAYITVKSLANPLLTLPVTEGFETTTAKEYVTNTIGLDGGDRIDFKTNSIRGRARTFVNSGFPLNGNKAITLDQFPPSASLTTTDSLLLTYNIATYNGNQLRIDFDYRNHGQSTGNPNNKVWIRGSDQDDWILAYDLAANQAAIGSWKHIGLNVNELLNNAMPAQSVSTSFQIKFCQEGSFSATVASPLADQDDGYTFDDVAVVSPSNDVAITNITSPLQTGCGQAGNISVSITVKNYSGNTFNNVPVFYSVNGGAAIADVIPAINSNSTQIFTFSTLATLADNADYSFDVWFDLPADDYHLNDSILDYTLHTSPVINTFPYLEGFEANDGKWYTGGANSSWEWGTPAKTIINKAANGAKAWTTSLTGSYNDAELSYLYSPCFDLSGLTQPVLSFSHIFELEDNCDCDYSWVEYSADGGLTWNTLGTSGTGVNWYNDPLSTDRWGTSINKWHVASIDIPVTSSDVRFRFVLSSDITLNKEGVGIDDIHIFDKESIYSATNTATTSQAVNGSNWIHFTSGGQRIASINANGNDLGNTTVTVYPYTGSPIRFINNQYYLNRNIVIQPTNQPLSGDVTVRFYFTDQEAKDLVNAMGCANCTKPDDPYELGVTKYSGQASEENGTLSDNSNGTYNFILPGDTEIIPYDNGYHAEFSVSNFSEFWLNNGGPSNNQPLPLDLISFEAVAENKEVLLQWVTASELNMDKYIVERSENNSNYIAIASVAANNNINLNKYSLSDKQPLSGLNYYRLKMIDLNGTFRYSPVKTVNFSNYGISIYPNPVTQSKISIISWENCNRAIIYDEAGKLIKSYSLNGRNNNIDLTGIAKGIYQLKIFTTSSVYNEKIMMQ